jgi:hypothetical protein
VVVAVEDYRAGSALPPLDGPASDATRFVGWLRERGVPDRAITVVASPLPANQPLIDGLNLPVRPATQAALYDMFARDMAADPADLFILVWGGHGVVDGEGLRRLFYADASATDKRNLDFTGLSRSLLTSYFPNFRRQLLIVDACQNLTSELRFAHRLPHQILPDSSTMMPDREQHILFAASAGQVAMNDSVCKTGLFSSELFPLLRDPVTAFPPDANDLAERLDRRFAQLRADGRTAQRPTYLWCRTPVHDGLMFTISVVASQPRRLDLRAVGAVVDAMLSADELSSPPDLQALLKLLPPEIRGALPYSTVPRLHLLNLVRTCERFTDGRDALTTLLGFGMSSDSDKLRVLAALDEHWPTGG